MTEPSGIALKAAYLLLRAMNSSPEPPSIERMALLLDTELNYTEAVDLNKDMYEVINGQGSCGCCDFMNERLEAFNKFANDRLIV